ncbi:GTPase IMAP family member 8-like [Odontesthes bonariensis]|uniref:GTPase IMAP family member 8-like n=1 Tax=Odontesthes bonariensis TaxID=219752 RepID=UPI003F588649
MASKPAVSSSGKSLHSSELRIVLIGGREIKGSKSSTGNFILQGGVFDTSKRTAQSVARQREVHGRPVTVVDTPGWWWMYTRENTPKLDQIEIQNSVHLCPPGPHVFLLVIPFDIHLPQLSKPSLKEHLELYGAEVLTRTIVLFTSLAPCSDKNVESKIKTSPTLQWILQQCGNRRHVLNIRNEQDSTQVLKLFEKIEAVVADNGGSHYTGDIAHGNALREEIKVLAKRASKRFDEVEKQRRYLKALIGGSKAPPEHLRLVIVGAQWAAKSSAGNTILGKNAFNVNSNNKRTMRCEISHGMVEGRRLTVVDSPGWFYNHTLQDTNEMDKLEIEDSVYLCPPGPHAVLLVIVLATAINASYLRTVQEHMSVFTDDVWKHTIVLFTRGDWLGVKTVEERIESEEGLQWLVNKCGNRYHVLNNVDRSNKMQVKVLLEKIEEMCAGNDDPYYEVDQDRATQIEEERDAVNKKARQLRKITERQSRMLKELFEGERQPINDMRILLVGRKGSGKSAAGNLMLFREVFETVFDTAWFEKNSQDQRRTATCVKHQGNFDGVKITVVEAPGWYKDTKAPDWLKGEVLRGVSMCAPGPHVFLLVVPIFKAFTERDYKAVVKLLMPFTDRVWRHCMVLFTWGNWLNELPIEEYIAREGKALQELLGKCGNRYHVLDWNWFGDPVPVKGLLKKIIEMTTQNKGCFSNEEKQRTFFWQAKQPMLTEEEWKRREQTLIDRVLKALATEPEEPKLQAVTMAHSMDDFYIPSMSGDAASEYGSISEFRNQRAHDNVAEWLRRRVRKSDITSGIGSICSSATYLERFDENPPKDDIPTASCSFPEKDKAVIPHMRVFTNSVKIERRNSC